MRHAISCGLPSDDIADLLVEDYDMPVLATGAGEHGDCAIVECSPEQAEQIADDIDGIAVPLPVIRYSATAGGRECEMPAIPALNLDEGQWWECRDQRCRCLGYSIRHGDMPCVAHRQALVYERIHDAADARFRRAR